MKTNGFYLIVATICSMVLTAVAIGLFLQQSVSGLTLVLAWVFWLLLPLAIYRELFYSRYSHEDHKAYRLRKHSRDYSKLTKRGHV